MYSRKAAVSGPRRGSSPVGGMKVEDAAAVQPAKVDGRTPWAAAGWAATARNSIQKQMRSSRRMCRPMLDARSLLRVPGSRHFSRKSFRSGVCLIRRQAIGALQVGLNSAIKPIGDTLAVFGILEPLLVAGIGKERNLSQHGGHVRAYQNDEGRLAYAAVALSPVDILHALGQGILNHCGEVAGFLDFFVVRDFLDDVLQVVDAVSR